MTRGLFKAWRLLFMAAGVALVTACGAPAPLQIASVPVPHGTGASASFDVVEIDQVNHRLYVADRAGGIDVFDISKPQGKYVKSIPLASSPNGLALAPDLGRLFAGLADGSVAIIDLKPGSATTDT